MESTYEGYMNHLNATYSGKKVLITGNTGFKGTWLSIWLESLGAKLYGLSDAMLESPSIFEECKLDDRFDTAYKKIEDSEFVIKYIKKVKPDFIFHLAAQALVQPSFADPNGTILTNAIGTANILEAARLSEHQMAMVIITSDKVYKNNEWVWGYKESDEFGGEDPYSASKGMAELAINSYFHSYLKHKPNISISIARAGNVIGGGDWAIDRIIPDCIRAWSANNKVNIRNPFATRPWQHVLEPVGGYLHLGSMLTNEAQLNGEAFNFGPPSNQNYSVQSLLEELSIHLDTLSYAKQIGQSKQEAGLLKLNIDKALSLINWEPALNFQETVELTASWYKEFYLNNKNMYEYSLDQINQYYETAKVKNLNWVRKK